MVVTKAHGRFIGNSFFKGNTNSKDYGISATLNRSDPSPGGPPEPDNIMVRVSHQGIIIAMAEAKLTHAAPSLTTDSWLKNCPYRNTSKFGTDYASMRLETLNKTPGVYCPPDATVLTLQSIEVKPEYRRDGVASYIMDFLIHTLKPNYLVAVIVPAYMPRVDKTVTNPAATDATRTERWLRANGMESYGTIKIPSGASTPLEARAFVKDF